MWFECSTRADGVGVSTVREAGREEQALEMFRGLLVRFGLRGVKASEIKVRQIQKKKGA